MRILILSIVQTDDEGGPKSGAATVTRGFLQRWRALWEAEAGRPCDIQVVANRLGSPREVARRRLAAVVQALLTGRAAKSLFQETSTLVEQAREAWAEGGWDLLIVNGSDMFGVARQIMSAPESKRENAIPVWLVVHNVESALYAEQQSVLPRFARILLKTDLRRTQNEEQTAFRNANRIICICEEDAAQIVQRLPECESSIRVEPVRFDTTPYIERMGTRKRSADTPLRLGMLGNFAWWPNERGLTWYCEQIFSRLTEPTLLNLFGPNSMKAAAQWGDAVVGLGEFENLDDIWQRADVMICPVFQGGGVRIKCAEAVWNGIPLVTTTVGMRGVVQTPKAPVFVCDTPKQWIDALNALAKPANEKEWATQDTRISDDIRDNMF